MANSQGQDFSGSATERPKERGKGLKYGMQEEGELKPKRDKTKVAQQSASQTYQKQSHPTIGTIKNCP